MPYIGHAPTNAGSFILLDDLEGTGTGSFNGSTVTFNLKVGSVSVSPKASSLIVSLDGVIQQSPSSYTTSGSTIVFTEAPAANTEFYGMLMGQSSSVGAGTITLADMAANSVDSDQYVDLSIDNAHVATGLDAVKLADGTVTNAELQYINSLSSNAQTQISAKSPTASPTFTGTVVLPNVPAIVTTQLDLKSPLASPTFTGTPAAPTASATTNTTQLATTAFVRTEVTNLIDSAPSTLDTLNELAAALGDDANFSTTVTNSIAGKSPTAGNTSLVTVGTITTGVWNAGAVTSSGAITGTTSTFSNSTNDIAGAKLTLNNPHTGNADYGSSIDFNAGTGGSGDTDTVIGRITSYKANNNDGSLFRIQTQPSEFGGLQTVLSFSADKSATFTGNIDVTDKIYIAGKNSFDVSNDGLYIGSTTGANKNTTLQLRTNDTPAIDIDSSQNATFAGDVLPDGDNDADLGSSTKRWANLYVADAHYSNVGTGGNDVDGTEGSWTIQEGEDDLFLLNRKNGKKYKFKLEEM